MKNGCRVLRAGLVFAMVIPWLAGCKNSLVDRSLIFATHTTYGLEVAVSPSQTDSPAKILIGYKRSEMVLNPVYHSEGVVSPAMKETVVTTGTGAAAKVSIISEPISDKQDSIKRYRHEAYSVLAKIATKSGAKAGDTADASMALSQWFATGEAAILLAKHPETAGALAGSSKLRASLESRLDPVARIYEKAIMVAVYNALDGLGKAGDAEAARIVASLDALYDEVPSTYEYYRSALTEGSITLTKESKSKADDVTGGYGKYEVYRSYVGELGKSSTIIEETLNSGAFKIGDRDAGEEDRENLRSEIRYFNTRMESLTQDEGRIEAETAALAYYAGFKSN